MLQNVNIMGGKGKERTQKSLKAGLNEQAEELGQVQQMRFLFGS